LKNSSYNQVEVSLRKEKRILKGEAQSWSGKTVQVHKWEN